VSPEEQDGLERTRKLIAKLEARARREKTEREFKYSPETIARYRELKKAGEFERRITARAAVEPDYDLLTFACGHTMRIFIMPLTCDWVVGTMRYCTDCAEAWLRAARGDGG
jgi:hypothetical protein